MNSYEQKQADRKARLEARAANARAESARRFDAAHASIAGIPPGQPILVGHHSERRHRRDLARHDTNMRKAIDADKKAEHYAGAAVAVGTGGISSDDPDALVKLKEKLAKLEKDRERMKSANAAIRKHRKAGAAAQIAALVALGFHETHAATLLKPDFCGRIGYADFEISNSGAEVRRLKQRIAQLEAQAEAAEAAGGEPVEIASGDGWRVIENHDANRVQILFDGKPPAEVRKLCKSQGFRWAPSEGAWQRQLNNAGRWAGTYVARQLSET